MSEEQIANFLALVATMRSNGDADPNVDIVMDHGAYVRLLCGCAVVASGAAGTANLQATEAEERVARYRDNPDSFRNAVKRANDTGVLLSSYLEIALFMCSMLTSYQSAHVSKSCIGHVCMVAETN